MTQPTTLTSTAQTTIDGLVSRLRDQLTAPIEGVAVTGGTAPLVADTRLGTTSTEIVGDDGTRYLVTIDAYPPDKPTP